LGRQSQFQWDGSGNMVGSTDPLGFSTQTFYNDHSKPITKSVSGGGLTITQAYQYDNKGNLIKATDPSGAVTQVNYDSLGRMLFTYF
jgi:YD repeat-containing protein